MPSTAASRSSKRPIPSSTRCCARPWRIAPATRRPPGSILCARLLSEKLQTKNRIEAGIEDVIVTVGGAHALYAAFQTILDPGDDMLLFAPYWTPIRDMVTMAQARPVMVPTSTARRNGLTATLEQFSTPATRAIYYNTPQNPSGVVFTRKEAEEVAAYAIKHNLIVVADEAYEDLVYEGEHVSIASLPGMAERTITAYTFSKTYAMTGWRAGYAVAKEPFMTGLRKLVLVLDQRCFDADAMGGTGSDGDSAGDHRSATRRIPPAPRSAGHGPE